MMKIKIFLENEKKVDDIEFNKISHLDMNEDFTQFTFITPLGKEAKLSFRKVNKIEIIKEDK